MIRNLNLPDLEAPKNVVGYLTGNWPIGARLIILNPDAALSRSAVIAVNEKRYFDFTLQDEQGYWQAEDCSVTSVTIGFSVDIRIGWIEPLTDHELQC